MYMSVELSVSEARANLPSLLNRVAGGEDVVITRHGEPVAMLVRPDRVVRRRAAVEGLGEQAAELARMIGRARLSPLDEGPWLTSEQAEELVADVRAGREDRPV